MESRSSEALSCHIWYTINLYCLQYQPILNTNRFSVTDKIEWSNSLTSNNCRRRLNKVISCKMLRLVRILVFRSRGGKKLACVIFQPRTYLENWNYTVTTGPLWPQIRKYISIYNKNIKEKLANTQNYSSSWNSWIIRVVWPS